MEAHGIEKEASSVSSQAIRLITPGCLNEAAVEVLANVYERRSPWYDSQSIHVSLMLVLDHESVLCRLKKELTYTTSVGKYSIRARKIY